MVQDSLLQMVFYFLLSVYLILKHIFVIVLLSLQILVLVIHKLLIMVQIYYRQNTNSDFTVFRFLFVHFLCIYYILFTLNKDWLDSLMPIYSVHQFALVMV